MPARIAQTLRLGLHDPRHHCLLELFKSFRYAKDEHSDGWQYAVGLEELFRLGATESDLRQLIHSGLIEHRLEIDTSASQKRRFQPCENHRFSKDNSCFALSVDGQRFMRWLSEDGGNGIAEGAAKYTVAQSPRLARQPLAERPVWKGADRLLYFQGKLVKRFQRKAMNQWLVLQAFEEEGWPLEGILDPLPHATKVDPVGRLRDTIRGLNRNQDYLARIEFSCSQSERRIWWRMGE